MVVQGPALLSYVLTGTVDDTEVSILCWGPAAAFKMTGSLSNGEHKTVLEFAEEGQDLNLVHSAMIEFDNPVEISLQSTRRGDDAGSEAGQGFEFEAGTYRIGAAAPAFVESPTNAAVRVSDFVFSGDVEVDTNELEARVGATNAAAVTDFAGATGLNGLIKGGLKMAQTRLTPFETKYLAPAALDAGTADLLVDAAIPEETWCVRVTFGLLDISDTDRRQVLVSQLEGETPTLAEVDPAPITGVGEPYLMDGGLTIVFTVEQLNLADVLLQNAQGDTQMYAVVYYYKWTAIA